VGPPGSKSKEIANQLGDVISDQGRFVSFSVDDLLNKEIKKKSEIGQKILQERENNNYISDEVIIRLVDGQVQALEEAQKSWILEGFPKTRLQALAMQKMGIIPDKFILLYIDEAKTQERMAMNMQSEENESGGDQSKFNQLNFGSSKEFNLKIKGVKEVCRGYINEVDGNKSEGYVLEDIVRELRLRRTEAPRRPPRVFMFGPPGAGKQTLGKKIAAKYQLVYLKVKNLVKDHIRRNEDTDEAREMKKKIKMNEALSNEFVVDLINQRLAKPDCRINGWILDGAPMNLEQTLLLKQ
jgi:adenylate kinase